MASLFNKINRLKQQPEWDWDHFQFEVATLTPGGIDLKVLQSYHQRPHKKPLPLLSGIIDQLHIECFPSPFPESLDRLMHIYRELKQSKRAVTRDINTRDLGTHAQRLLDEVADDDYLSLACLRWLLGNIEFDRIAPAFEKGGKTEAEQVKRRALALYQQVATALEAHNLAHPEEKVGGRHLYRIHHNMLACYLSAYHQSSHENDQDTLQYLRDSDYLMQCRKALDDEPFQWAIASSGLRFSSLLKDAEQVRTFFSLLTAVTPRFVDLSYEPFNQVSISVMPDYQWAIKQVLTPAYLRQKSKELSALEKEKKGQHAA